MRQAALFASIALLSLSWGAATAQESAGPGTMTFFVTSVGSSKGADLGGLEGADRHCQNLAQAAGASGKTWRAYLSTQATGGANAVNARDRIGRGPWQNVKGVVVAKDVADLHRENNINKQTALTERGDVVNGRGDNPNTHDMITGSQGNGTTFPPDQDRTCGNYTKSGSEGVVMLGHHDRMGTSGDAQSWNAAHESRGCSQDGLRSTGGAGLFYCFAAN